MTAPEQFDWRKWAGRYCDGSSCGTDIPTCNEALLRRALEAVAGMVPNDYCCERHPNADARISDVVWKAIGGGKP